MVDQVHAVVLAGGSGARFWPLSRELQPKQLLSVFGSESLIAQAIRRVRPFVAPGRSSITIVTNERLFDELRNHLAGDAEAGLGDIRYLVEPVGRNTAPAIALAAADLLSRDPEAVMIVVPSDHLLDDGEVWADAARAGCALAADGYLVTLGVKPTRPDTGYGYIEGGAPLAAYDRGAARPLKAAAFTEKPDAATARCFVEDDSHFWNAGIFIMKAASVLDELEAAGDTGARIAEVCRWVAAKPRAEWLTDEVRDRFASLPSISIDKAVMETSSRVAVVPADLRWSDVGSLLALETLADPDGSGNVRAARGTDLDSSNTVVYSSDRLVATVGVQDLLVVDTADATLVCAKDRCQDVRQLVDALKALGAEEVTNPRTSLRPWGTWTTLLKGPSFQIKLLEIKSGAKPSLQRHRHRSEHWVVVTGTALVTRDDEQIEVHANESVFIPIGAVHRLENCGKVPLKVIEVQVGEYLEEDDIVRLEDDWHRERR